jgi:methyltransferase family protein
MVLATTSCRLCAAPMYLQFTLPVMDCHQVGYYKCSGCLSLQTEKPYWLDRAYSGEVETLDVGRVQRNVLNAMLCAQILDALGVLNREPCLDWGAAEGLFVRLMRDRGFNFFSFDKYCRPLYTGPFQTKAPADLAPFIVTAFEVLEHFPEPALDLAEIFALKPRLLLATTECYDDQKDDWWYLAPFHGQHVFFYSQAGLKWVANRFAYRYFSLPPFHLFAIDEACGNPELSPLLERMETLIRGKDVLYRDAIGALARHFVGNPWTHVNEDYQLVLKTTGSLGAATTSPIDRNQA